VFSTMRPRSVALAASLRYSYVARIMLRTYPTVRRCNRKSCKDCCFVVILLPCCNKKFLYC
jgi:hypothetical protein